ncbi:F-box protein AFR [Hibiscus syriacus]|uniref:F-box protein AFR n=1 Tax=Hibiscus syriacus TaxID=106335 RepID=A0A6A2YSS9_HIBSY|nr:F-box protein AFR-like [Hibiscus syriacus]KAE8682531.1 F-box protein AFR [Hibiscus syriacus]
MAVSKSFSGKQQDNNEQEYQKKSEPLIPGLPDEIAELCLLHLPYPYQSLARSVCSSWNRIITDPAFLLCKRSLSLSLPYLFIFAFHKSTARIQWQALDPRSGRWFILPSMPCSKAVCPPGFACTSIPRQGQLYVLGGMCSDTQTSINTTMVYTTSTNQWSIASPMVTTRSFFAAGNVNGKIIAVGGSGAEYNDSNTSVECYDPQTDTWEQVSKMRVGLARYDSAEVGGKMYVTEGWTWPFLFSPRGGVYDPESDTWHEMKDGMKEGWTGVSVVVGDRLFVISEYGDCPMKVYVPDRDTWQYVGGDKFPRETIQRPFALSAVEGKIYVVSSGLNVAIGSAFEGLNGEFIANWEVMPAPKAFRDLSPSSCQALYA